MVTPNTVLLEIGTTTIAYLIVVYYVMFHYRFDWTSVVGIMTVASIVTAYVNRALLLYAPLGKTEEGEMISLAIGIMLLYGISSIIVLGMLVYRFGMVGIGLWIIFNIVLLIIKKMVARRA